MISPKAFVKKELVAQQLFLEIWYLKKQIKEKKFFSSQGFFFLSFFSHFCDVAKLATIHTRN
jgi:hypothetical protein